MTARPRREQDDGFTFVELVVSMTVIALGIMGAMGVMGANFTVASTATARTRAVALATQKMEALRAEPFEDLAVSGVAVTETVQVAGTRYTVETVTAWKGTGTVPEAYKQAIVAVSWVDPRGFHLVDQTSYFSEPGFTAVVATSSCSGAPTSPQALEALPTPDAGATAIDVSWQPGAASPVPVARWTIERSVDGFVTSQLVTEAVPGDTLAFRSTGLAPGTSYSFRVAATSPCGESSPWSGSVTATTDAATVTGCSLGAPNVSPAHVSLANNGKDAPLRASPVVTISATGTCEGFSLRYRQVEGGSTVIRTMSLASGSLTGVVDAAGPWDVKVHTLEVYGGSVLRASLLLTVCSQSSGSCS